MSVIIVSALFALGGLPLVIAASALFRAAPVRRFTTLGRHRQGGATTHLVPAVIGTTLHVSTMITTLGGFPAGI